jgi:hypothetical protein
VSFAVGIFLPFLDPLSITVAFRVATVSPRRLKSSGITREENTPFISMNQ